MWRIRYKMPARKPKSLIVRHETAAEAADRARGEEALQPERPLPVHPPSILRGMKNAETVWRRLIRLYGEIDGTIVTRLDMDLLVNYCILADQVMELDGLRRSAMNIYDLMERMRDKKMQEGDEAAAAIYATKVINAFEGVVKIDARVDQKRKTLFSMQQSMYMTPRARAGAAPKSKPPDEPIDPMEALLGEVTDFVNKGTGDGG
jgi:phage terminase small subunit